MEAESRMDSNSEFRRARWVSLRSTRPTDFRVPRAVQRERQQDNAMMREMVDPHPALPEDERGAATGAAIFAAFLGSARIDPDIIPKRCEHACVTHSIVSGPIAYYAVASREAVPEICPYTRCVSKAFLDLLLPQSPIARSAACDGGGATETRCPAHRTSTGAPTTVRLPARSPTVMAPPCRNAARSMASAIGRS